MITGVNNKVTTLKGINFSLISLRNQKEAVVKNYGVEPT